MKISRKTLLISVCMALSPMALPTLSVAGVSVDIDVAPPVPRVEVVPAPRAGFVWAPGFWEWRDGRHVWVGGRWIGERPGFHWAPDRWVQAGPHWHHEPGHWER